MLTIYSHLIGHCSNIVWDLKTSLATMCKAVLASSAILKKSKFWCNFPLLKYNCDKKEGFLGEERGALLVPDMAMVKVIMRSLGLILPVFPLSKARKMLRRTMSASHLCGNIDNNQQPQVSLTLGKPSWPPLLSEASRPGPLGSRLWNYSKVPQSRCQSTADSISTNNKAISSR